MAILCLAIQWSAQIACGDAPAEVGRFGDLWQISIEGAKMFSPEEIQKQLRRDLELQIVSAPMRRWPPIVPC